MSSRPAHPRWRGTLGRSARHAPRAPARSMSTHRAGRAQPCDRLARPESAREPVPRTCCGSYSECIGVHSRLHLRCALASLRGVTTMLRAPPRVPLHVGVRPTVASLAIGAQHAAQTLSGYDLAAVLMRDLGAHDRTSHALSTTSQSPGRSPCRRSQHSTMGSPRPRAIRLASASAASCVRRVWSLHTTAVSDRRTPAW